MLDNITGTTRHARMRVTFAMYLSCYQLRTLRSLTQCRHSSRPLAWISSCWWGDSWALSPSGWQCWPSATRLMRLDTLPLHSAKSREWWSRWNCFCRFENRDRIRRTEVPNKSKKPRSTSSANIVTLCLLSWCKALPGDVSDLARWVQALHPCLWCRRGHTAPPQLAHWMESDGRKLLFEAWSLHWL